MPSCRIPPELLYEIHGHLSIDTRVRLRHVFPLHTWRHRLAALQDFDCPLVVPTCHVDIPEYRLYSVWVKGSTGDMDSRPPYMLVYEGSVGDYGRRFACDFSLEEDKWVWHDIDDLAMRVSHPVTHHALVT
jgi:hypothetical protein